MKIAIRGHESRGKEVIQILESLGGKKLYYSNADDERLVFLINDKGYISCIHAENSILKESYKTYTLEEFEKEFPFKIGDKVFHEYNPCIGTVVDIKFDDNIPYRVNINGTICTCETKLLNSYKPMDTRNITLTLDKAKEWYNKGGELKEIALQAFTEKELNPLPKSWKEFCQTHHVILEKYVFPSWCPNKYIALWKLEQLRDCYRQGWKPTSQEVTNVIKHANRGLNVYYYCSQEFLSFQSQKVAEEFLKNFEPLIKEAGDLI